MHLSNIFPQKERFQLSNHLNFSEVLQITNNPVLYLKFLCPCSLSELWPRGAAEPNFPQLSVSKSYRMNCSNYNLLFTSPYKKTLHVRHVNLQTRHRDATKFQRVAWLPPSGGWKNGILSQETQAYVVDCHLPCTRGCSSPKNLKGMKIHLSDQAQNFVWGVHVVTFSI